MAKFFGEIGFLTTQDNGTGIYTTVVTKRNYSGDVLRNTRRFENSGGVNDNINVNNQISIVADAYAYANFGTMGYIKWEGQLWKITNVEVQRPRLLLTIGGVYNGPSN